MCFARDMPCGAIRINIISHVSTYIAFAEQKYRVCQRQTYRYNHKITIGNTSINRHLSSAPVIGEKLRSGCFHPDRRGSFAIFRYLFKEASVTVDHICKILNRHIALGNGYLQVCAAALLEHPQRQLSNGVDLLVGKQTVGLDIP